MNYEILEGLKQAVSKGESLQRAMGTFYNAGYSKSEIEEAAREVQMQQSPHPTQIASQIQPRPEKPKFNSGPTVQKISSYLPEKTPAPKQTISNYEQTPKPKGKWLLILLVVILLILLGGLAALFIFKQDVLNFIANL